MINFAVESFVACIPEIKTLITAHYEELALNRDKVPLDPRWDVYEELEKSDKLLFIALRNDDKKLIGYSIGLIEYELHYKTTLGYNMDILYVDPEYRGHGAGNALITFLEAALKERKVQRIFLGSKCHKDIGNLFIHHDYKLVEMYYSKWIGE